MKKKRIEGRTKFIRRRKDCPLWGVGGGLAVDTFWCQGHGSDRPPAHGK